MAIRNKECIVRLDQEERESLKRLVRGGKAAARKISRARILLKADVGQGSWRVGARTEHRSETGGLAVHDRRRPHQTETAIPTI